KGYLFVVGAVSLGLLTVSVPAFAHHGNAAFDLSKPVVLKGAVVMEFRWINPHPLIKADYKDAQGKIQKWTMEMGSTVSAQLIGWGRTTPPPRHLSTLYIRT